VTKASDKISLDELRRANQQQLPRREVSMPALPFYERHPEWKPRPLTRREARRHAIRERL
jgi:hypothetical protein